MARRRSSAAPHVSLAGLMLTPPSPNYSSHGGAAHAPSPHTSHGGVTHAPSPHTVHGGVGQDPELSPHVSHGDMAQVRVPSPHVSHGGIGRVTNLSPHVSHGGMEHDPIPLPHVSHGGMSQDPRPSPHVSHGGVDIKPSPQVSLGGVSQDTKPSPQVSLGGVSQDTKPSPQVSRGGVSPNPSPQVSHGGVDPRPSPATSHGGVVPPRGLPRAASLGGRPQALPLTQQDTAPRRASLSHVGRLAASVPAAPPAPQRGEAADAPDPPAPQRGVAAAVASGRAGNTDGGAVRCVAVGKYQNKIRKSSFTKSKGQVKINKVIVPYEQRASDMCCGKKRLIDFTSTIRSRARTDGKTDKAHQIKALCVVRPSSNWLVTAWLACLPVARLVVLLPGLPPQRRCCGPLPWTLLHPTRPPLPRRTQRPPPCPRPPLLPRCPCPCLSGAPPLVSCRTCRMNRCAGTVCNPLTPPLAYPPT